MIKKAPPGAFFTDDRSFLSNPFYFTLKTHEHSELLLSHRKSRRSSNTASALDPKATQSSPASEKIKKRPHSIEKIASSASSVRQMETLYGITAEMIEEGANIRADQLQIATIADLEALVQHFKDQLPPQPKDTDETL